MILFKISVCIFFITVSSAAFQVPLQPDKDRFPADHHRLAEPLPYKTISAYIKAIPQGKNIKVTVPGQSVEGRDLFLVNFSAQAQEDTWKVFFFAQQHGNEPAGKDALMYLIRYLREGRLSLPPDVDLWILPQVNPDGAAQNKRRNANDADLNRDHRLLFQPETRILYDIVRKVLPHVAVDCHEFVRNSLDYKEKGWLEWPQIMMDHANNPYFDRDVLAAGERWCRQVAPFMALRRHNYSRYYLGAAPPRGELRHSTPETDDARNGIGAYGGLSFIIESGRFSGVNDPNADLPKRIDAYLDLLTRFLVDDSHRKQDMTAVRKSSITPPPNFIPVNYFWANLGLTTRQVKVIEAASGETDSVLTANFMQDLVVKRTVQKPRGYVIKAGKKKEFAALLKRHALDFRILSDDTLLQVSESRLIRIESARDSVYQRYGGRQIVTSNSPAPALFKKGSLLVDLERCDTRRACLVLEPNMLYGIYTDETFGRLIRPDGGIPVYRYFDKKTGR